MARRRWCGTHLWMVKHGARWGRRALVGFFIAGTDATSSSEMERRTQLLVEKYMKTNASIEKAWRYAGARSPIEGTSAIQVKVGRSILPINTDGTFPNGAVLASPDRPADSHGELL